MPSRLMTNDDPPELTNGSGMPLVGINPSTTLMFTSACAATIVVKPIARNAPKRSGACIATRLTQAPATIDGILCWDLFDFLDKVTGQALARKLVGLLRPGGALYGCFGTTPIELHHYTRCSFESADTLRQRPYAATPVRRTVLVTRDIIKMFDGLVVAESVLLKSSTRETLFRRP